MGFGITFVLLLLFCFLETTLGRRKCVLNYGNEISIFRYLLLSVLRSSEIVHSKIVTSKCANSVIRS